LSVRGARFNLGPNLDLKEFLKYVILLGLYGVAAPLLGVLLRKRPAAQRWTLGLVCFMTLGGLLAPAEWGLTLSAFEYRGHERGYHFYFAEVPALALIVAKFLEDWRRFRWLPPGLWLYLAYVFFSFVSILNAPAPSYVCMAAFKFLKVSIFFVAAYNYLRDEGDLEFFLRAMAYAILWELVVVLKMKYMNGVYQVAGTFEHQNALSMFVTLIGMIFLAAALGPKRPGATLFFVAYIACAAIQQSTLSRGGLVIFAAGTAGVCLLSLAQRMTVRRMAILGSLAAVGFVGLVMTMDTIIARFHDYGNESSQKTRELLNVASRRMLSDYPLGIGWNNFALTINKPWPYGKVIDDWERAGGVTVDENAPKGIVESHYYLLLSETGYQGYLSYLLFISVFLWWNFRGVIAFRNHFLGAVSLGIGFGTGMNYVQSLLERVLTQPRNMMLWMMLLAVTARIELWRRSRARQLRSRKLPVAIRPEQHQPSPRQPRHRQPEGTI